MRFVVLGLTRHPDTPCRAVERIEVRVERTAAREVGLSYTLHGDMAGVRIPERRRAAFADELWRHTCTEAFVLAEDGGYVEFNFSPSGEWAAYRFSGYRAGMSAMDIRLSVACERSARTLRIGTTVPAGGVACKVALSAVVEEADGRLSYWALRHPAGKPDFHHCDSFALPLDEVRD